MTWKHRALLAAHLVSMSEGGLCPPDPGAAPGTWRWYRQPPPRRGKEHRQTAASTYSSFQTLWPQ